MRQFSFPHTPIMPVLIFVQTYGCLHLIRAEFKIVMSVYVEIMPDLGHNPKNKKVYL